MGEVFHVGSDGTMQQASELLAEVLAGGGMAVFPTDTVYGIGLSPAVCSSPQKLFDAKRRPSSKAIPWLVGSADSLHALGSDVPDYADRLAARYWPGGLTLVVRAAEGMPKAFLAGDGTIALRVPASKLVTEACAKLGGAVATTSANTSGMPPATAFDELEPAIIDAVELVIDAGDAGTGDPSSVVVCTGATPIVVREAAISASDVADIAGV